MRKVFEAEDATFEVDEDHSIFSFIWNGTVSEQSVKKAMTLASKVSEVMDQVHWLIDRRNLEGYSVEARIWLKNEFMDEIGIDFIAKTDKIAAVNSVSAMSQVSSKVLIDAIKQLNDSIEYKEFDTPLPATNWLQGIIEEPEPVKKKRGLFRRK